MNKEQKAYIASRQTDALLIETLLSAAYLCQDRHELLFSLLDAAHDAAKALNVALDSVSLPQGERSQTEGAA